MELKDVKTILKRVEVNYNSFNNDSYTQAEWYRELKDYDFNDVMDKLEQHFRSEEYGSQIPKVYFLTKYLKTSKDKSKIENHVVICPLCKEEMKEQVFDTHFGRCSSTNYIIKQTKKYLGKDLDRQTLMNMPETEFDEKYNKLLKIIQRSTKDEKEAQRIGFIFNPPSAFKMEEIIDLTN